MSNHVRHVALALLLGFAGAADARSPADEMILIRFRFPYQYCVGVCPNFEMKVSPRGEVVTRELFEEHRTNRWRATSAQLDAFRRALAALRPTGEKRLSSRCEILSPDGKPDPMANDPRPDDFEVRWTGGRSEARLTACYDIQGPTREMVRNALRALGADPYSGWDERVSPCGPGRHLEPDGETSASTDDKTPRLSVSVCRP